MLMDKYTDFQTHTRLRAACKHFRQFLPLEKVVDFKTLEELVEKYNIKWRYDERERSRVFQEAVHLDISPATFIQGQYEFLCFRGLDYELCRVSRVTLDNPLSCRHINLLYQGCYSFVAAAIVGDVDLMRRLLLVPKMNPAYLSNRATVSASTSKGESN